MSASRAVYYVLDNSLVTAPLLLMPDSDNKRAKEFSVHFTLSTHSCLSTSSNHQFELSLGATPPNQDCVSMHIPVFFIFPKPRLSILNFATLEQSWKEDLTHDPVVLCKHHFLACYPP